MSACPASAAQEAKNNHILRTSVTALEATYWTADNADNSGVYSKIRHKQAELLHST